MVQTEARTTGEWAATERQNIFIERTEYEVLYGGSKFGLKTDALLIWTILRRQKYPRSRGLFIRRELAEVTKQGAAWDRSREILGAGVTYNQTDHKITFPNGSVLEFGHCQNADDMVKYQGAQYDDLCFDQLEQFSEQQYLYIQGACRVPLDNPPRDAGGRAIEARIRCSANPGDVGHSWVKARFIDIAAPNEVYRYDITVQRPDGKPLHLQRDRVFIPASVFDSVEAGVVGAEYIATLEAMPEPYKSAYLYGLWDVFVGQAFGDFQPMREGQPHHVIPYDLLPTKWRRVAGHDWGYDSPCYTLWGALDPYGGIVFYRELWARNWDSDEIATQNLLAQGGERISQTWCDPSIWASYRARLTQEQILRLQESGQLQLSIADQYAKAGWGGLSAGNNDRLAGKMAIHRGLKERPDGTPWVRVMESCPRLITTLQQIQLDTKRSEDVVTDYPAEAPIRDEPYDVLRYIMMGLVGLTGMPKSKEPARQVRWGFS